ncbi:hypothetical protein AA313_de0207418 [Arthrobotrys entomopaga]|nr:hypothetical protein AA313_de0207418 [Arthrobotrys entomopaga]
MKASFASLLLAATLAFDQAAAGIARKKVRAETTSEVVKTMTNGVCHYFVAKSGSHTLSTVSAWCVDKPIMQTAPPPTTTVVVVLPTTTSGGALSTVEITSTPAAGGWCKLQVAMSDNTPVTTLGIQCVL